MLGVDAIVLWQFHLVNAQSERLNGIDQKLVTMLRVHTSLLAFYTGLEGLTHTEDAGVLLKEAGPLRTAALEEMERAGFRYVSIGRRSVGIDENAEAGTGTPRLRLAG